MANEMLGYIEDILKETDEIKTKLEERGLKPSIKIEQIFKRFDFDSNITIEINY